MEETCRLKRFLKKKRKRGGESSRKGGEGMGKEGRAGEESEGNQAKLNASAYRDALAQ